MGRRARGGLGSGESRRPAHQASRGLDRADPERGHARWREPHADDGLRAARAERALHGPAVVHGQPVVWRRGRPGDLHPGDPVRRRGRPRAPGAEHALHPGSGHDNCPAGIERAYGGEVLRLHLLDLAQRRRPRPDGAGQGGLVRPARRGRARFSLRRLHARHYPRRLAPEGPGDRADAARSDPVERGCRRNGHVGHLQRRSRPRRGPRLQRGGGRRGVPRLRALRE